MRTPEFCVSTKPGRAACETRCPRQGAVFSAPRSGRGRTDREGTLGARPPPRRCHTPSRLCAWPPAAEAAFLGLTLSSASISTACSHQGERAGPCLALHALPGQTSASTWCPAWLLPALRTDLSLRTCSEAAHLCVRPSPGSFPGKTPLLPVPSRSLLPAQGPRHGPG